MSEFESLGAVFTAWADTIEKARKPKGLKNWQRLKHVAHKMEGKGSAQIKFTAVDPVTGETSCHILGSTEGNLKFLMGYGNPGFHMAPYHWQIIDPNLSDEDAELMHKEKGHPSNPKFWASQGLPTPDEGDMEEGEPHPGVSEDRAEAEKTAKLNKQTITVDGYRVDPVRGKVENLSTGHSYAWDIVQDTYFAYTNPKVKEAMEEEETSKSLASVVFAPAYGEQLEELRKSYHKTEWNIDVYPLVQCKFPPPGSLVRITKGLYGLVTDKSIEFYDEQGFSSPVDIYGSEFIELDLRKSGNMFPSVVFNFATEYMNLDREQLLQYEHRPQPQAELDYTVKGTPTPGVSYTTSEERVVKSVDGVLRVGGTE